MPTIGYDFIVYIGVVGCFSYFHPYEDSFLNVNASVDF